jgi:hypothetical protein
MSRTRSPLTQAVRCAPEVLSPGREARRRLAFLDAWAARGGDPLEFRRRAEDLVALNDQLFAEQMAESGFMPTTLAGCVGVLHVAAAILNVIGADDELA